MKTTEEIRKEMLAVFRESQAAHQAKLAEVNAGDAGDLYVLWYPEYGLCIAEYTAESLAQICAGAHSMSNSAPIRAHTYATSLIAYSAVAHHEFHNGAGERPVPVLLSTAIVRHINDLQELIDDLEAKLTPA